MNWNRKLCAAASAGDFDKIKEAIKNGANIHANKDLALRITSTDGELEIVKYLIEQKANIHADDDEALRKAALWGHLDVVKYLKEQGADIHARNDDALGSASQNGHFQVCQYLVSLGADPQKAIDDETIPEENKQCLISIVRKNKLTNELAEKPLTKAQKLSNDIEGEDFSYKAPTTKTARTKL